MPKYKDNQTGIVYEFDHEPTPQELEARASQGQSDQAPPDDGHSLTRDAITKVGAPMAGFSAGGAIGGKPGAVLGAMGGTAYGDLYNTLADHGSASGLNPFGPMQADTSQLGPNAPPSMMEEVKKLLGVGAGAAVGAYGAPHLAKLPGPLSLKTIGLGAGGGYMAGRELGHPMVGAGVGAAMGGYNVASGLARGGGKLAEWLTTPKFGPMAAEEATATAAAPVSAPGGRFTPEQVSQMSARPTADGRARFPGGPTSTQPPAPQAGPSFMDRARSAGSSVMDAGSSALNSLKGLASKFGVEPPTPAAPYVPKGKEIPYSISEDMLPDASHVKAPSGGDEGMIYPNMTREPNLKYGAEVSASPQRPVKGPNLSQTHPLDPEMPWEEHMGRSTPKRTSPRGGSFGGVEVSTPLKGLEAASPVEAVASPPIGVHDEGLQRWIEGGGTPEGYAAARGRLQASGPVGSPKGFGPNTVGAAERGQWLPKTVDDAEGMSLLEQEAWEGFKRSNPGTSDSMLNSWFTSNQMGADPHANLDLQGMIDRLLSLIGKKP